MASAGFLGRHFAKKQAEVAPLVVEIPSPLSGRILPLAEVSDRAFAEKMMGEGIAIIPDGRTVFSPFSGVVDTIAETGHAIGLRSDEGIELLIHVGIETVRLKGKAFKVHVVEGARVKAGESLIDFDLEAIRAAGYETVTPVTVINGEAFEVVPANRSETVAVGDPLLVVREKVE